MLRLLLVVVGFVCLFLDAQISSGALHARSGIIVYDHSGHAGADRIFAMTTTGADPHPLTLSRLHDGCPCSFSPNGRRIVFVNNGGKSWDLWTMNADGNHKRRLTFTNNFDETDPAWSPNGQEIAFAIDNTPRKLTGLSGIWVMDANGTHRRQLASGYDGSPSWSPDGKEIAYTKLATDSTNDDQIYVVSAVGGSPTNLTNDPTVSEDNPAWSPNDRKILFDSDRGNSPSDRHNGNDYSDLWTMNPDGSDVQRVTNTPKRGEGDPSWSPSGRWIAYDVDATFGGTEQVQIYEAQPNGSQPRLLTHPCRRKCGPNMIINAEPIWQPPPG